MLTVSDPVWALYLGRVLQAVAGSAAWLVCTAMITENAGDRGTGTVMGLSTSFITIGTVSGPMLGGVLLGWVGYWAAWSVPIGLLLVDMIARMVVVQPERHSQDSNTIFDKAKDSEPCHISPNASHRDVEGIYHETSPLLPPSVSRTKVGSDTKTGGETDSASVAKKPQFLRSISPRHRCMDKHSEHDCPSCGPSRLQHNFTRLSSGYLQLGPITSWRWSTTVYQVVSELQL